jgi:hypothetical protein
MERRERKKEKKVKSFSIMNISTVITFLSHKAQFYDHIYALAGNKNRFLSINHLM